MLIREVNLNMSICLKEIGQNNETCAIKKYYFHQILNICDNPITTSIAIKIITTISSRTE
jgi:hypothetical protein